MAINEAFDGMVRSEMMSADTRDDEGPGSAMDFLNASKQNPPGDKVEDMRGSFGGSVVVIVEALDRFRKTVI